MAGLLQRVAATSVTFKLSVQRSSPVYHCWFKFAKRYIYSCKHSQRASANMSKKLLLDVDCGVDDAQAIMLALAAPRVDILGITCVHGNTSVENVCKNTLRVLKVCNKLEIPVFKGASKSILGHEVKGENFHGLDGLGDAPDPNAPSVDLIQKEGAVSAMIRIVNENPGEVSLVATAPLTNLALAVLYNMFSFVAEMPAVEPVDVFLGVARFFVVGLGGMGFGILFGFVSAFTTRFTSKVKEIEPLFIFMYSYLAYLVAELFAISSIMAIVTCALTMKYYVEENVSQRSCTTIRHVVKMLGSISETLIFFFLGVVTITTEHEWNWGFILFTLFFAFVWRGLGVLVLTQIINPFRTIPFNMKDQFGLAYGGLRGAVSFALAFTLPDNIGRKQLFVTATIVVILFTVFLQGISIRPLIEFINVRRTNRNLETINVEVHCRLMEHTIAGIEDLCGQWSHFYWKDKFLKFNTRILRRILIRDSRAESSIVALYKKLELQNAMEILDTVASDISAAPSIVSLYEEKKNPKPKTFMAADLRNMHDILSKNMYRIRQRTAAFTSKHALPNEQHSKEILIRRHASIRRSLRPGSFQNSTVSKSQKYFSLPAGQNLDSRFPPRRLNQTGDEETMSEVGYPAATRPPRSRPPARSSSRAMMPLRRLHTLTEAASVDVLNEISENPSSAAARRPSDDNGLSDNLRNVHQEAEEEPAPSPPPLWAPEPRPNVTRNPLLRRPQWNPKT
uniref:Sodium/hydrogen exchanger n=1 Tax=Knipowitschia caucasica TaxID=637954 RepID=A0AAV2K1Z2_KNICA